MKKRYLEKVDFIKKIFDLEDVDRPAYVIGPGVDYQYEDFTQAFLNPQLQLSIQLKEIRAHEEKHIEDDYILMLMPWFGVVGILEGFGGDVMWSKNDYPKIDPILKNVKDICTLKKPDVKSGLMGKVLEFTKYFQEETGYQYPICLGEHMSPLEIVFALMETTDLIFAMMDEPKLIHDLLSLTTETICDFIAEQRKEAREYNLGLSIGSTGIFIPEDCGIWMSADSIVNLSPELFEEFFVPYLNILSEKYGGIFLHSCGNFEHLVESLVLIENLRGIDFGASETSYDLLVEEFSGKVVLAPHLGLNNRIVFHSLEEYAEHLMQKLKGNTGNYFQIQDINSLGYGDDVVKKIGSFNATFLDQARIDKLVRILNSSSNSVQMPYTKSVDKGDESI